MKKRLMHAALTLSLIAGTTVVTTVEAEAHRGRRTGAIIAGSVIGLGVLGAYAATRDGPRCYEGRRVCDVVGTRCWRNHYGERVCKEDVRCYRPTVCD